MYWSVAGSKIRRRGRPTIGDILATLSSTIALLNRCYVNKTLSIMIFSLLFRYISTKLFNKLVTEPKYCSQSVGQKLRRRLDRVKEWAEKEGMELPAEKHLSMIVQAGNLLQSVKKLPDDAQNIYAVCSKLNSRQVTALLEHCSVTQGEPTVTQAFANAIITLAQMHTDEPLQNEGMEIPLEEDPNLELAFLIPPIGYYCDSFRGIPQGLQEYFDPMISAGLCKFTVTKDGGSNGGLWAVPARATSFSQSLDGSFSPPALGGSTSNVNTLVSRAAQNHSYRAIPEIELPSRGGGVAGKSVQEYSPKIVHITLTKENNSLGLSIIGGKNYGEDIGIYVKSMVEGGAAFQDGSLQTGDQILRVDDFSLEGCTQEEAAQILRATGKVIHLTVAKQAAQLQGLTTLIQQPSPRHTRKNDQQISEGSSHVRKAKRRQQREKQRQERYQHHEFRLERRKPSDHNKPPQSPLLDPALSGLPPPTTQQPFAADPRIQSSSTNPQFAKWIMEQNSLYNHNERPGPVGSETDLQSSVSSLANIPERERPISPGLSYSTSSTKNRRDPSSSRNAYYRPQTPPVRDTSVPSRATTDFDSYSNYDTLGSSVALDSASEAPSKFSDYPPEPEPSLPVVSQLPAHINSNPLLHGHQTHFSSVSSQMTFNSQLTPCSQQQNPSQQMHLDKLSMDVMYHTQLSGNSMQGGITSVISKLKPSTKSAKLNSHLDSRDLKEFELDDIELEKQRIQLMFYEQQRQKELSLENSGQTLAPSNDAEVSRTNEAEFVSYSKDGGAEEESSVDLATSKQELESLESMISEHKKRYRELKYARDREEQGLKKIEMKLRNKELLTGKLGLNTSDQHGWPMDPSKLHDLERSKADHNKRLQNMIHNEHRTKTKLKALESQASEIRQRIQSLFNTPTQLHSKQTVKSPSPNYPPEVAHHDTLPSKLISDVPPQKARKNSRSTDVSGDWDLTAFNGPGVKPLARYPNRIMSMESVTTATYDQPDIARELAVTISESNLTEPTRDDPPRPINAYISGSKSSMMASGNDLRTSHSSMTHITETDDVFIQDEWLRMQREEHALAGAADLEPHQLNRAEDRNTHLVQLQQEAQQDRHQRRQQILSSSGGGGGGGGGWEGRKFSSHEDVSMMNYPVSHEPGWRQPNPHSKPHQPAGWSEQQHLQQQQQGYPQGHIYDVPNPNSSRPSHQRSTGHHYSKHSRSRAHHARNQPTSNTFGTDSHIPPNIPEHPPVQDNPRIPLAQTGPPPAAPDVIPASFANAVPTTGRTSMQQQQSSLGVKVPQQRQVTGGGGERTTSPLSRNFAEYAQPQSPSYNMSGYAHYAVPPSRLEQERSHSSTSSRPQQQSPIPANPEMDATTSKSPTNETRQKAQLQANIYDQPKLASPRHPVQSRSPISRTSPHGFSSSSRGGTSSNMNIYDTPHDHMIVPPTSVHHHANLHANPASTAPLYMSPRSIQSSDKVRTAHMQMAPDRGNIHHSTHNLPAALPHSHTAGQHNHIPSERTPAVHHHTAPYNSPLPPERYTTVTVAPHNPPPNIHTSGAPHNLPPNILTSGAPHNPPPNIHTSGAPHNPLPTTSSASVHRYGNSREGVKVPTGGGGHSYMRGRPEQALTLEDRMKAFVDRSHRNQGARHPERIQRQQTEL